MYSRHFAMISHRVNRSDTVYILGLLRQFESKELLNILLTKHFRKRTVSNYSTRTK